MWRVALYHREQAFQSQSQHLLPSYVSNARLPHCGHVRIKAQISGSMIRVSAVWSQA
jgi:hypothetical protein